jgi:hypothetical protein
MCTLKGLAIGALGCLMALPAAGAQSVVRGRVLEDSTRAPLADVEIVVSGVPAGRTTPSGEYTLDGLKPGMHQILFRRIGYRPVRLRAILVEGDTLEHSIVMERAVAELPPLEVTVANVPPGMERFAERRATGMGTYWDARFLRNSEHRRLATMLTSIPGVRPVRWGGGQVATVRRGGGGIAMNAGDRPCYMAVWLDGVQIFAPTALGPGPTGVPDLEKFKIQDLEAVEIYPGPATLPPELSGTGGMCGAIVLWSRRR